MLDMILKEYVSPKRFSILAYVCVIIHFHCGVFFTTITAALRLGELEKFSCAVNTKVTTYKTYVEKACFSSYEDAYNSPVRFYAFVMLSFGSVLIVTVIYSLAVGGRIDEIEINSARSEKPKRKTGSDKKGNNEPDRKSFFVFNFYVIHLLVRSILGILFTILQHAQLYPSGFDLQFGCAYTELMQSDRLDVTRSQNASVPLSNVTCNNSTAPDKQFWGTIVSVCNLIFAVIELAEVIYLILHPFPYAISHSGHAWSCDSEFIVVYFLRKQYVCEEVELTGVDNGTPDSSDIYKQNVLKVSLTPDINYGPNASLDDMFINVVIQTEQAPHKFSTGMDRHEINNVYMKVPEHSICLEAVKDLFYPNKDTKGNFPRAILALGRPGIGKTVLTRKIMCDWANGIDEFYRGKVNFFFKFRWFNFNELRTVTLKTFLRLGTGLNEEEFERIFEEISMDSKKAIFIFDGLDELSSNVKNFEYYLDQSEILPNDPAIPMSAVILFIKIACGYMVKGSTVLVTSRPTANDFYSKLKFSRRVEIIGFTSDKIEQYVEQFCANNNKAYLKSKIWSHVKSSSELENLCYIPVNCFIVCVTLLNCLSDPSTNDNVLPTTLTELYLIALVYFKKHHDRNESKECHESGIKGLQHLAFYGMENNKLIFCGELVNEQMIESGLLHCLPVPFFLIQSQVCFIHLTVQEFLAAKHVVETKEPEHIKEFISSHFQHGKWHLVLQFLAGLLGKKMKISDRYRSCVLAFTEHLSCEVDGDHVDCHLNSRQVLGMKCVREIQNEEIAKETAATSALKDVTRIEAPHVLLSNNLTSSDWAAIVFVCKYLSVLTDLSLPGLVNMDCLRQVTELLRGRCIETLHLSVRSLGDLGLQHVLDALIKSNCSVNHEHANLTVLALTENEITDAGVIQLRTFLKNGHGSYLKKLNLKHNKITSCGLFEIGEVLCSEVCRELTVLNLSFNSIGDEGVHILCNVLKQGWCNLAELHLSGCSLTKQCVSTLVDALGNENCSLTKLRLDENNIDDEGVRMLCSGLSKEQCQLTVLYMFTCSLTSECMLSLCETLADERCKLTNLNLSDNDIGDEGLRMLCGVLTRDGQCKLTVLCLSGCSLTDECMPSLCEALADERCGLTKLDLRSNDFTDKHISLLSDVLKLKCCCLQLLYIYSRGSVNGAITGDGRRLLHETIESENCKARGLQIFI